MKKQKVRISKKEFAEAFGVSRASIYRWLISEKLKPAGDGIDLKDAIERLKRAREEKERNSSLENIRLSFGEDREKGIGERNA